MRMRHLLACIVALGAVAGPANAVATRLTLDGRVIAPDATPVAGATVSVYTAQPRVGIGSNCPSCYPECGKTAVTDRKGRFRIAGLSDQLLYQLLFVADGRVPEFHRRVDPLAGSLEQVLRARDTRLAPGLRTLVGHVVDSHGQPVAGASVSPRGMQLEVSGRLSTMFGDLPHANARIDPMAITDANGEFRFTGPDSVQSWVLEVRARGLSPRVFPDVSPSGSGQLLRLTPGATVTGVVLRDGQPFPGAVLGISQVDRNSLNFVTPDTVAADEHGRFTFANVPPGQDHAICGVIGSMGPWALRTVVRTVGEDDSVTTLPPLSLERGYRLKGRVTLSDGKPVPAGTELVLGRTLAWGNLTSSLREDGAFEFEGLPPETVALRVRVRGYHIAPGTPGDMGRMGSGVRIPMLHDHDNVEIVLEPDAPPAAPSGSPRP